MRSAEFRLVLNSPVALPEPAGVVDIYTLNGRSVIVPDIQFGRLRLLRGDRQGIAGAFTAGALYQCNRSFDRAIYDRVESEIRIAKFLIGDSRYSTFPLVGNSL